MATTFLKPICFAKSWKVRWIAAIAFLAVVCTCSKRANSFQALLPPALSN